MINLLTTAVLVCRKKSLMMKMSHLVVPIGKTLHSATKRQDLDRNGPWLNRFMSRFNTECRFNKKWHQTQTLISTEPTKRFVTVSQTSPSQQLRTAACTWQWNTCWSSVGKKMKLTLIYGESKELASEHLIHGPLWPAKSLKINGVKHH